MGPGATCAIAHQAGTTDYPFAIRRQCTQAAFIKFSLASGVRNAECADSVTLDNLVSA